MRAVMCKWVKYVLTAGVVVITAGVDVVNQVFMGVIDPAVNHGDVDAFTLDACRPNIFDINVFVVAIVQVPLASVQRIADLRIVQ